MGLVVRLARHGAKKRPFYRVVVADSRHKRDGRHLENLGTFLPTSNPPTVKLNRERITYWQNQGARLTDTIKTLVKNLGPEA